MPEDDEKSHDNHETPNTNKDEEHGAFLLQRFDITCHDPPDDPAIVTVTVSASNGSESNRASSIIHILG